jgi:cytochrome c-type biogenesis protein CcmE
MTRKQRRLGLVALMVVTAGVALGLVLFALNDSVSFFRTPGELAAAPIEPGKRFRLGGLVAEGSVERDGEHVRFVVTDFEAETPVTYTGILPDLFREGQGVIAEGTLGADGVFAATEVLAKHDENYMPPEVADKIRESGQWRGNEPGEDRDR